MRVKLKLASSAPPAPSLPFTLVSLCGAGLAIAITAWLSQASGAVWLMAPFGASCVLAFGLPDSPLAQPRSIIGGHMVTTLVGLLVWYTLGHDWWGHRRWPWGARWRPCSIPARCTRPPGLTRW